MTSSSSVTSAPPLSGQRLDRTGRGHAAVEASINLDDALHHAYELTAGDHRSHVVSLAPLGLPRGYCRDQWRFSEGLSDVYHTRRGKIGVRGCRLRRGGGGAPERPDGWGGPLLFLLIEGRAVGPPRW